MKWTDDQYNAIYARHSNLLVSAAAGSGKTAVLVERIIRLVIEEHVNIDEMLIVTFTNAAASEMRERIIKKIYEELSKTDDEFLRNQLSLIGNASIMTIHSFCMNVIRNNASFIDLDPGFKMGETTELSVLEKEAMDNMLEERYLEKDPSFIDFIDAYGGNKNDKNAIDLIYSTYQFIMSKPEPFKWLKEAVENMDDRDFYTKLLDDYILFNKNLCLSIIEEELSIINSNEEFEPYRAAILSDQVLIENFHFDKKISFDKLKAVKGVDEDIKAEIKSLRDFFKKAVTSMKDIIGDKSLDEHFKDLASIKPRMKELEHLTKSYQENYFLLKEEKNILDFNDLEHLALKALKIEAVSTYYKEKFQYIFLDEYQDSNLVQETIINSIKRKDNVFLVGDVKQSIYKFRLADPTLFMDKYHSYSKEEDAINRRIDLKKNFRTRYELLEAINRIFSSIMSEDYGELSYDEDSKLYKGMNFEPIKEHVDIHIIETDSVGDELDNITSVELEALLCAKKIKELYHTKTYDAKQGIYREVEYKDMVILMRAISSSAPIFQEVFLNEGIPIFADFSSGYFDAIEIKVFVNLLKIIDNPYQDVELLSVLRSSIFNFSIDELIEIRLSSDKKYYYECFYDYTEGRLLEKIEAVKNALAKWKKQSLFTSLDKLMWEIMLETGYYHFVSAMPGGDSRKGNLNLLIDRAKMMEENNNGGLYYFIHHVEKLRKSNSEMGTAKIISENDNVVRVMSIHKSKGLEFPIVILAGVNKKFNLRDSTRPLLFHKDYGLASKYIDYEKRITYDTMTKKLIKNIIKNESIAEEMRVLYVALTRVVDKLVIVGTVKNLDKKISKWKKKDKLFNIISATSYLDFIMMSLFSHINIKPGVFKIEDTIYNMHFDTKNNLLENLNTSSKIMNVFDQLSSYDKKEITKALSELEEFHYPYPESAYASKVSVSELKSSVKEFSINSYPKFVEKDVKKSGTEFGNMMHLMMKLLNRKEAVKDQIKGFLEKGIIDEEDLLLIDTKKIELFFESELGRRYINSSKVYKEKPFVLKKQIDGSDVLVQGIIDCFFKEGDSYVLLDYKTDFVMNEEELISRYKIQLDLYREAIEKILKKEVKEVCIYSFHLNKKIII